MFKENIILYLIDMNILSAEQLRWKRFCEGVDFSGDTGEVVSIIFNFNVIAPRKNRCLVQRKRNNRRPRHSF